jgi:tetratricopeptide (TPR) repeat protein
MLTSFRLFWRFAGLMALILSASSFIQISAQDKNTALDFAALAKSAETARAGNNLAEAIRDYREALELQPDWQEGLWYVGTLEYERDHYAEALPAFQQLTQLAPEAGPAWNFLGLCEYETKDYANALQHLTTGQKLGDADDPEVSRVAKYHLALLLIHSGNFETATAELGPLVAEGQSSTQVKIALALATLRAPVLPEQVDPSQDALLRDVGSAATLLEQGPTAAALASLAALLEKYPATPYLHLAYGSALFAAQKYQEAATEYRKESKVSGQSPLPYVHLALCELAIQHPREALQAAREAVRLAPNSSAAHELLAKSLEAANEPQRAREELAAAKQLLPERLVVEARIRDRYSIGSASTAGAQPGPAQNGSGGPALSFEELSRQAKTANAAGDAELAMSRYQEALKIRPDWQEGLWNLAMVSYSSRHYTEAIAALKKWLERTPNSGTAWAVTGLSEFELKDYDNALIHLERGQELGLGGNFESVQLAKYRLGILLNRNGQFEAAEEILNAVAGKRPLAGEVRFALGMSLLRLAILPGQMESANEPVITAMGEIAELLKDSGYDEAFPKFEALLRQYPSAPFVHYVYGTALAALSRYDEADDQLEKEILLTPVSELPYLQLASIALKRHRAENALASAQQAVKLAPRSAEAHYLLGRAYMELGNDRQAVEELETAAKIAPGSPQIHFNLAKAYAKTNLPEKAAREREIFAGLNAQAEERRSLQGPQSYGAHNAANSPFSPADSAKPVPPEQPENRQ